MFDISQNVIQIHSKPLKASSTRSVQDHVSGFAEAGEQPQCRQGHALALASRFRSIKDTERTGDPGAGECECGRRGGARFQYLSQFLFLSPALTPP